VVPPVEAVPPLPPKLVWSVLMAGTAACAVAALMGVAIDSAALGGQTGEMADRLKWASGQAGPASQPGSPGELRRLHSEIGQTTPLSTVRIGLVGLGALAAAGGLCMRGGGDWRAWLVAAGAAVLGGFGLPMHWDSIRLVLWVAGTAAAVGGGLAYLPPRWRYSLLVPVVLFHFAGILTATTWPDTQGRTAWLPNQVGSRVYLPYFKFMYLSNAYHFYSPDPGPASKFCVLIEYEIDDTQAAGGKRTSAEWVELPKRRTNYRDPLGLTYYRRLSITELASYSQPGTMLPPSWEKAAIMQRRTQNELDKSVKQTAIPGATSFGEVDMSQYRQPQTPTRRATYPSYARHIADEFSGMRRTADGRELMHTVTGMKMFRVEHRIIDAPQFLRYEDPAQARLHERNPAAPPPTTNPGLSPYHPAAYAPYYLGEYGPDGKLRNPNDPLLFWLTPVQYLPNADKNELNYKDWMSEYAGHVFPWEGKE
jgi:hypothetical protein